MHYYDNTIVSSAKNCLRQYYYRHNRAWVGEGTAAALIFGLSWHEAMDVVWALADSNKSDRDILELAMHKFLAMWTKEGMPSMDEMTPDQADFLKPRTPGVAMEMIHHYIRKRRAQIASFRIIAIEQPFAVPIFPDDREVLYVGRFDKVVEDRSGRIIIPEHKTTSSYKKDGYFRNDWLDSWSPNSQIDGYLYAAHMMYGDAVKEVWVDGALVHATVHEGFKFIPVARDTSMLSAWLYETRFWINLIMAEEENHDLDMQHGYNTDADTPQFLPRFPKNTGACSHYSGCSYRDLCRSVANPALVKDAPLGYKEDRWSPFDVLELERLGLTPERGA